MSINAENIIGSYDIHSKQYILTFTNRPPAPVIPTDCSFSISVDKFVPAVIRALHHDRLNSVTTPIPKFMKIRSNLDTKINNE